MCVAGRVGVARVRAAVRDAEPGGARARVQRHGRAALRRAPRLGRRARGGRRHGSKQATITSFNHFILTKPGSLLS